MREGPKNGCPKYLNISGSRYVSSGSGSDSDRDNKF